MSGDQLSLYLDLEDGKSADLEVAARASIALAEAVREISVFLDPFSTVRVELIDSSEGSLFLNTKINIFGSEEKGKKRTIMVVLAAISYVCATASDYTLEKGMDWLREQIFGAESVELSDADKDDIAKRVAAALAAKAGEKPVQRVYRELGQDPAIKGVGLSNQPKVKPKHIVPRSEFAARGGLTSPKEQNLRKRTRIDIEKVVLISPVLVSGKRRWKFRSKEGEFGAPIRDEHFVESVLSGQIPIVMKSNVEMTVEIETTEEFRKGVWVPIEKEIIRIVGVPTQFQGEQDSLPFNN